MTQSLNEPIEFMSVQFSEANRKKFEEFLTHYPTKRAAILPTFWLAQEQFGYLSNEAMEYVAKLLDLSPPTLGELQRSTRCSTRRRLGSIMLQICTNLSCTLRGAEEIVTCVEKKLGIGLGETTADKKFTLSEVECLGSCGTAPMAQINDDYYENLTPRRGRAVNRPAGKNCLMAPPDRHLPVVT